MGLNNAALSRVAATEKKYVELKGLSATECSATRIVLTGPSADSFNEDGQTPAVKPVASEVTVKAAFEYEAPAHSLTVFRFQK